MTRPVVLVVTRREIRKHKYIDYLGEYHLDLLMRLRTFPVMVPVVQGTPACLPQYRQEMAGLLLVEGEDVVPARYRASREDRKYVQETDALKDVIEIGLARYALRHDLPILAICRGMHVMNVVCGGTLYGDVQKQQGSRLKHIDYQHYDTYRHPVTLVEGSLLARWYRHKTIKVNSYHHQGIRRLARRFEPMAYAADGLIEAYCDPQASFLVGLQFHPERMLAEYAGNWRLWKAFGSAIHQGFRQRQRPKRRGRRPRLSPVRWAAAAE
jgi:gamma-glutamyl-gamma-aminobutyrate hydrolase PuuD